MSRVTGDEGRLELAAPPTTDNVTLLGWVAFFSGMAQEMVYPLLPAFVVVAFASSASALGATEGALAVGVTLARLGTARLLDRGASPRRLTRIAYTMSLLSRPLIAVAPSLATVGVLRLTDGIGKGGKDAPRDTLVAADSGTARAGRGFGIQRMLDTFGSVAGPVAVGVAILVVGDGSSGLRWAFLLSALPAVAAACFLTRIHDIPHARHDRSAPHDPLPRAFKVLLVAVLLFGLANSSDTLLLLRASQGGLSSSQLAFAYAALNVAYAALAVPAGIVSDRVGRRPLLLVAWAIYACVYVGFAVATQTWQLWFLFILYGLYYATADGTLKAWVAGLVPAGRRGAAYGIFSAASGLLVLPASLIAGRLWDEVGPSSAFLFGAAVSLAALAIVAVAPSLRQGLAAPDPT